MAFVPSAWHFVRMTSSLSPSRSTLHPAHPRFILSDDFQGVLESDQRFGAQSADGCLLNRGLAAY